MGTALLPRLVESGRKVYCVSRSAEKVPEGATPLVTDLRSSDWTDVLSRITEQIESLVYLAYSISGNKGADWRVNSLEMQTAANYVKPSEIIYTGSIGVFGAYPDEGTYTERSLRTADTEYTKAKLHAVNYLKGISARSTVLHPSIVWAQDSPRVDYYKDQLRHGYYVFKGDGSGIYNIVHAEDVANAILLSIGRSGARFEEYIVNAEAIPFREWIELIESRFGYAKTRRLPTALAPFARGPLRKIFSIFGRVPMKLTEPKASAFERNTQFSSAKIARDLGWHPRKHAVDQL